MTPGTPDDTGDKMPDSIVNTNEGTLLIANGINLVLRWDGVALSAEPAGVIPPATAPTLAGSGNGNIIGTYYGYVRFKDKYGNFSNLSPISAAYTTNGQTGTITNATKSEPIKITSSAHGLLTGAKVKITGVEGMTEANGTWTIIKIDNNKFSLNGSAGVNTYTGGGEWIAGQSTINYTNVAIPTQDKVTHKQILRNTDGQTTVFYVDIETADLSTTSFSSTKTDTVLQSGTAVPLSDSDGNDLAISFYTVPPTHKSVLCSHRGRMWMAAEIEYREGAAIVTLGSTTVTGIKTEWSEQFVNRSFYVVGESKRYTITSVDSTNQTVTLSEAYAGETEQYAEYAIAPTPGERRLVYFSSINLPEAWPPTNTIAIEENGDDITGLVGQSSFLYILEKRHIYRFSFQDSPAIDGEVFLAAYRGCINNRCWVALADGIYMLDFSGIHRFDGNGSEPVSAVIQEIFENKSDFFKINWKASAYFHAVLDQQATTIRWFVALAGNTLPRHALCLDYVNNRWWIEEYYIPVGCSAIAEIDSRPYVLIGGPSRRVYALGGSELDGTTHFEGTVRGSPTGVTILSLTDSAATFSSSLAFSTICIVGGRGKGQIRQIVKVVGTTRIEIDRPWSEQPSISGDDISTYQIGGIQWEYLTGWFHVVESEQNVARRIDVFYDPTTTDNVIDLQVYADHDTNPMTWAIDYEDDHIKIIARTPKIELDTTAKSGFAKVSLGAIREFSNYGPRWASFSLSGAKGQESVVINHIDLRGWVQRSGISRE